MASTFRTTDKLCSLTFSRRKFVNKNGLFYPPNINLLVVVEKNTDDILLERFPFQLTLDWNLKVDIHENALKRTFTRLVNKAEKHEGWKFKIKSNYNPKLAQAALDDAIKNPEAPSHVGLYAAAKSWRAATGNL